MPFAKFYCRKFFFFFIDTTKGDEKEEPKSSSEEDKDTSTDKIENTFSLNSSKPTDTESPSEDMKFSKSPDSETDSEPSSKGSPILERHIFLCGQCSEGFMTLDECKQHMVDVRTILIYSIFVSNYLLITKIIY